MRSNPSRRQLAKLTGTTGRGPHWIGRRISAFALNAKRPMDRPPTIHGDMRFREWIRLAETEEDRTIRYRMSNKLICLSTWKTTSSLRISVHGPRFHCIGRSDLRAQARCESMLWWRATDACPTDISLAASVDTTRLYRLSLNSVNSYM